MRPPKKPGPKSKTRAVPQKKAPPKVDLGDEDTESDESFHSPPLDSNITDYSLDFTNATVRRTPRHSPRRPGTLQATAADKPSTSKNAKSTTTAPPVPRTADSQEQRRGRRRKQLFPQHKEWKKLLTSTDYMIPRAPFSRVIREIMQQQSREVTMITKVALEALQVAAEKYIEQRFEDAYLATLHAGRKTLFVRDMALVNCLLSRFNMN